MTIPTVSTIQDLRAQVDLWRRDGLSVGLVPTMGALHDGHLALVRAAAKDCDRVIVSIFVNPTQFGPGEDYDSYPRDISSDLEKLAGSGLDLVYAPSVKEIYPDGAATSVHVSGISQGLCGATRPIHFDGVATVVTKLLLQALPDTAYFGEKDYQQLQVIARVTRDLSIPVAIAGVPTVREEDGLALSSRNAYLTPDERAIAPALYEILNYIAVAISRGDDPAALLREGAARILKAGFASLDYLELRDAQTLEPVSTPIRAARLVVAAQLGSARLIDNVAVPAPD